MTVVLCEPQIPSACSQLEALNRKALAMDGCNAVIMGVWKVRDLSV